LTPERPSPGKPERLFFPAVLLLAAIAVPLKAAESAGLLALPLPLFWHGHEMIFGVAYGVIGGYLLVGMPRRTVATAFAAWLIGRGGLVLHAQAPLLSTGLALAYPAILAVLVGTRFLHATKSARNAVFAPILFGLLIAQIVYEADGPGGTGDLGRLGLLLAADLIFLMLFTMGGRIIAAASSGAHQSHGRKLTGVAHPRLELAGIAALAVMLLLEPWSATAAVSGVFSAAAGGIVLLRLWRWHVWRLIGVREVSLLHLGYSWLAAGLLAKGWAQFTGSWPVLSTLHIGLVGGFGTLALTMIFRASLQRARRPIRLGPMAITAILLVSAATLARLIAVTTAAPIPWLLTSAMAWTAAMCIVLEKSISLSRRGGARQDP